MSHFYTYIDSPLGKILLLSDGSALTGLYFVGQKHEPVIDSKWKQDSSLKIFSTAQKQLSEYFEQKRNSFDFAFQFKTGTAFQQKVWQALTKISYGKTVSYKELAESLGTPKSVRAVAAAVGRNPGSIIIPCHRVIGQNGTLTGYAGGLQRKRHLIDLEQKRTLD